MNFSRSEPRTPPSVTGRRLLPLGATGSLFLLCEHSPSFLVSARPEITCLYLVHRPRKLLSSFVFLGVCHSYKSFCFSAPVATPSGDVMCPRYWVLTPVRLDFKVGLSESLEYFLPIVHLFPERAASPMYVPKLESSLMREGVWVSSQTTSFVEESRKEWQFDGDSFWGPKSRITMLMRASSKLRFYALLQKSQWVASSRLPASEDRSRWERKQ
jgi:hypothetical protein